MHIIIRDEINEIKIYDEKNMDIFFRLRLKNKINLSLIHNYNIFALLAKNKKK